MSTIQDLIKEIDSAKKKDADEFEKIKYTLNKKAIKKTDEELIANKSLPELKSKEEMYKEMKQKFKSSWKSPGYVDQEFSNIPTLRGKVLSAWEYQRTILPERAYKYPKGYKGIKIEYGIKEFGKPDNKIYPKTFRKHLIEVEEQAKEYQMRPSKYGKLHIDETLENIKLTNKEPFRIVNTAQIRPFNMGTHLTWESEYNKRALESKKRKKSDKV